MTTTVFISGAARGIGLELARSYHAAGARVIAGQRDPAGASAHLPFATVVPLDVSDDGSAQRLGVLLRDETIDILINNAGIIGPERQSGASMDFGGFLKTLNVNTLGPLRVTQALLPALKRAGTPRVAVISSRMGSFSHATPDRIAYRASKAAVNKVFQCLATDLAQHAIAVAALHPGWVRTDMGGAHADIDATQSAAGIKTVMDRLTLASTGRFWNYDGSPIPW